MKKPTSEVQPTVEDPVDTIRKLTTNLPPVQHISDGTGRTLIGMIGDATELPELTDVLTAAADRIAELPAEDDKAALHKAGRLLALRVAESEINAVARGTWMMAERDGIPQRIKLDPIQLKQYAAKEVTAICRKWGVAIANPENGEPCTLLAINTGAEGRYVLENRRTKKRSHTTRDLSSLLPLKVVEAEGD